MIYNDMMICEHVLHCSSAAVNTEVETDNSQATSSQLSEIYCRQIAANNFVYFDSLESVLKWNQQQQDKIFSKKLENFKWRNNATRTLICHDHKGGYLNYESFVGCEFAEKSPDSDECAFYSFFHWWYIDVFVYFSHHFVTVPPLVWINQAHQHGVLILGTFITESDTICAEIFSNTNNIEKLVSNLVLLCKIHNFDGWLINIENTLLSEHLDKMQYFLGQLKKKLRDQVHNCTQVIWYDSVTLTGELKWQNELNNHNKKWFNSVDGFYTNYAWKEQQLQRTLETLFSTFDENKLTYDIYIGIDVFGRGCLGCGGWNCVEPMELVRRYGFSTAIFAPGWICEKFPGAGQQIIFNNSFQFWNLLKPYLLPHKLTKRNICTNFSIGFSSETCVINEYQEEKLFCMQNASLQPFYLNSLGFTKDLGPGLIINGGGFHELFICEIRVQQCDRHLKISYRSSGRIDIVVEISNGNKTMHLCNECSNEDNEIVAKETDHEVEKANANMSGKKHQNDRYRYTDEQLTQLKGKESSPFENNSEISKNIKETGQTSGKSQEIYFYLNDKADWCINKVKVWTPPNTDNLRLYHFVMCIK